MIMTHWIEKNPAEAYLEKSTKLLRGEALRDDENYTFVSAWKYKGDDKVPELHKENLNYEEVTPTQRSYK